MREQIAQRPPIKRRASAQRRTDYPASPQAAGHYAGLHPEDAPYQSSELTRGQGYEEQEAPDSYYPQRIPSSARRYTSGDDEVYEQGNRRLVVHHGAPPKRKRHIHPLLIVGIVASVIIAGVILLSQVEVWWVNQQNTWAYGYPRLYQTDAVVGHEDSSTHPSHFLALNLNGKIQIIEVPGGDTTHEKVYIGPTIFSDNAALVPVTVSFKDVNGDGKPDMLIHIQDQTVIFLNSGSEFKPAK